MSEQDKIIRAVVAREHRIEDLWVKVIVYIPKNAQITSDTHRMNKQACFF